MSQLELARRSHDGRNRLVEARNAVKAVRRACVEGESNDDVETEKHGTLEVVGFTVGHFFFRSVSFPSRFVFPWRSG